MIVISGALVLVALVLLVLGVTQSDINLVYGCIVVSLVSLVFLVLGIVQRRGEVLPGAASPAEPASGRGTTQTDSSTVTAPAGTDDLDPDPDDPAAQPLPAAQERPAAGPPDAAGQVVVIPDRNRYHRADCRHVRDAPGTETLSTAQAGQQGYAACGVCKP